MSFRISPQVAQVYTEFLYYNGSEQSNFCQYTKSCIFGWKNKLKICTTKVVYG
jgi:hypothetical protein